MQHSVQKNLLLSSVQFLKADQKKVLFLPVAAVFFLFLKDIMLQLRNIGIFSEKVHHNGFSHKSLCLHLLLPQVLCHRNSPLKSFLVFQALEWRLSAFLPFNCVWKISRRTPLQSLKYKKRFQRSIAMAKYLRKQQMQAETFMRKAVMVNLFRKNSNIP